MKQKRGEVHRLDSEVGESCVCCMSVHGAVKTHVHPPIPSTHGRYFRLCRRNWLTDQLHPLGYYVGFAPKEAKPRS